MAFNVVKTHSERSQEERNHDDRSWLADKTHQLKSMSYP
jgi:hypothetical protein